MPKFLTSFGHRTSDLQDGRSDTTLESDWNSGYFDTRNGRQRHGLTLTRADRSAYQGCDPSPWSDDHGTPIRSTGTLDTFLSILSTLVFHHPLELSHAEANQLFRRVHEDGNLIRALRPPARGRMTLSRSSVVESDGLSSRRSLVQFQSRQPCYVDVAQLGLEQRLASAEITSSNLVVRTRASARLSHLTTNPAPAQQRLGLFFYKLFLKYLLPNS